MRNHTIALLLSSPVITEGVKAVLRGITGVTFLEITPGAKEPHTASEKIAAAHPSLTIVDIFTAQTCQPDTPTLLLTSARIPDTSTRCHKATVSIYEPAEALREKIRQLLQPSDREETSRGNDLSPREKEVILGIVKGLANKEIAAEMNVSVNTIMTHRRNIAAKLQIHSPAGLTIFAIATGMIKIDDVKI